MNNEILRKSAAASEGLNLQTCGVLINFDMPWNPMMVEQRIGRVDRIGQKYDTVWIRNYFYEDTVEADIYHRLDERIASFEQVVGELQPILGQVNSAIQKAAMSAPAERNQIIQKEIESINRRLNEKDLELLALDRLTKQEAEAVPDDEPPLGLPDLERSFLRSRIMGERFTPHPDIEGAYQLDWDGQLHSVTFDPELFDQHPNTLQLLSYGNPLFTSLLNSIEEPEMSEEGGKLARATAESPFRLASYYSASERGLNLLSGLESLSQTLTTPPDYRFTKEDLLKIKSSFQQESKNYLRALGEKKQVQKKAGELAVEAKARELLLKAAYIELAKAEKDNLFDPDIRPVFTNRAILSLRRHGTPFQGLVCNINTEGLVPKATDDYYQNIKNKNLDQLNISFEGVRNEATKVLEELAGYRKANQGADIESNDGFIQFFADWG